MSGKTYSDLGLRKGAIIHLLNLTNFWNVAGSRTWFWQTEPAAAVLQPGKVQAAPQMEHT